MFGIGLPEMIVILAVALIVVGPEKLPDMARSVAKWMFELKKTVNQVKESLADEENLIGSVHSDLKKTADDLKGNLVDSDDKFTWYEPEASDRIIGEPDSDVIDMEELKPVDKKNGGTEIEQQESDIPTAEKQEQSESGQEDDQAEEEENTENDDK